MIYEDAVVAVATMCSDVDGFARLLKAGLNADLFVGVDPAEAHLFTFTRDWFLKDGTTPPRKVLEDEFGQIFTDPSRDIPVEWDVQPEYVVKTLKNNAVKTQIQGIAKDTIDRIFEDDADQVEELAVTHRAINGLYMSVSGTDYVRMMSEATPETVRAILTRAEDELGYKDDLVKFPYGPLNDYYFGLRPRELAVFFGYTGDMKSFTVEYGSLMNAMAGKRVAHFTFENGIETTVTRMLAMLSGISLSHLFGGSLPPGERVKLAEAEKTLASLPILIDESPGASARSVEAVFTRARTFGADLVIIDQANWIVAHEANYRDMWANLATVTRKIQEHTNELGCVTFLASQANRESQKTKKGTGLAHIAGTDELTKTASYAISLDYDETSELLLCRVVKARGGKKGVEFDMQIHMDTQTTITLNSVLNS